MSLLRRHLSYANVAATLALLFAMSGSAMAAKHYLLSSTKQISPALLKKLRGARGATGAPGAKGAPGATGATGHEGKAGNEGASASASLATAFVQMTFSSPIALEAADTLVLSSKTSGGGKNLVLSGSGAHVLLQATIQLENTSPERAELTCNLAEEPFAGGGPVAIGIASKLDIPAGNKFAELPLTASVSLVGGETYDLRVYCHKALVGSASADGGSLNAVAYE
jgi:hypothetical protein